MFGYLGYLRVSNLAPASAAEFDPSRHTTREDVLHSKQGILLSIKWTKTRQAAVFTAPVPLPALGTNPLCPLTIWREYEEVLSHMSLSPNAPLLLTATGPPGRTVTIPILRALLRRAAHLADLSSFHYTPHSLRRGGPHLVMCPASPWNILSSTGHGHLTLSTNTFSASLISTPL